MDSLNPQKIESAVAYIDKWIDVNFKNGRIPGMQVAIQHGDKLIYSRAFGYANVANKQTMTTKHVFRVASQSKTFTATALMQLEEAGKLHLDDKVSQYLDWFHSSEDNRVGDVTIRQLMNHTAGVIRDGLDADFWQLLRDFPKEAELREFTATSHLVYDSDTKFKYSNFGYGFLGLVIANVSGLTYREYVTQYIVEKLGLESTGADLDEKAEKLLATGYGLELFDGGRKSFAHVDTFDLSPATGFYSNAEDMCRYFSAHFIGNDALLNDASKRRMQHGYWDAKDDGEEYGLGMIHYEKNNWVVYGHSGGFPGFITNTQFDAERQLVVSVLTNSYESRATSIGKGLISIIDTFQQDTDNVELPISDIAKFEGRFYSMGGVTDIVAVGKKLFAFEPLWWNDFEYAEALEVKDENTLFIKEASGYESPGEHIIYEFDSDQHIKSIINAGSKMLSYEEGVERGWF